MANALVYTIDGDDECFLQLVTSINSVKTFIPDMVDVFILTNKPTRRLESLGAKVVDVSRMVEDYGLDRTGIIWRKHPVSPMLLFRLLVPLVPELKAYDKILYLDTDTEVWDQRFFSLFDLTGGHELTGVQDSLGRLGASNRILELRSRTGHSWKNEPVFSRWIDESDRSRIYANSGVLVFDMNRFASYEPRARYLVDRMSRIRPKYPDQDMINVYFDIKIIPDRKFNGWGEAENGAWLMHYVGFERKRMKTYPAVSGCRPVAALDGCQNNAYLGSLSGIADRVYVLDSSGRSDRQNELDGMLERMGISEITRIDTKHTGLYDHLVREGRTSVRREHVDNIVGHYKAVADAIEHGYRKIAVFESDYIPLGLERELHELKSSPDFDLAICTSSGKSPFYRSETFKAPSSKGYIAGRRMICHLMTNLERMFDGTKALGYVHRLMNSDSAPKMRVFKRR